VVGQEINWSYRERREGRRPATPISREYSRYFFLFFKKDTTQHKVLPPLRGDVSVQLQAALERSYGGLGEAVRRWLAVTNGSVAQAFGHNQADVFFVPARLHVQEKHGQPARHDRTAKPWYDEECRAAAVAQRQAWEALRQAMQQGGDVGCRAPRACAGPGGVPRRQARQAGNAPAAAAAGVVLWAAPAGLLARVCWRAAGADTCGRRTAVDSMV
jgi:hypothetical protein